MTKKCEPTRVELIIPCQPEYAIVAKLAISGIACRTLLTCEEIDDLRIAIGELCSLSVKRAQKNNKLDSKIILQTDITPDKLIINFADTAGPEPSDEVADKSDTDEEELDQVSHDLIKLLVDEVDITHQPEGTCVRMVKHAGQQ